MQYGKRNYDAPFDEIQDVFNKFVLPIIQHPKESPLIAEQIDFVANMVANWELRGIALFCHWAICWAVDNPEKQNLFYTSVQNTLSVMLRTRVYGVPNGKGNPPEKIYKIDRKFYKYKAIKRRGFSLCSQPIAMRPQNDSGYCDSPKFRNHDNKSLISDTCTALDNVWEIRLSNPYEEIARQGKTIIAGVVSEVAWIHPELSHKNPNLNWAHDITYTCVRDVNMRKFYTDALWALMKCFAFKENTRDPDWARFGFCFMGTNARFFTNPFPELIEKEETIHD